MLPSIQLSQTLWDALYYLSLGFSFATLRVASLGTFRLRTGCDECLNVNWPSVVTQNRP
jgi:hypothetical protein